MFRNSDISVLRINASSWLVREVLSSSSYFICALEFSLSTSDLFYCLNFDQFVLGSSSFFMLWLTPYDVL